MKPEYAHKLGYLDGYEEGVENNPYDNLRQSDNYLAYRKGYDEGVAEYCREIDGETNDNTTKTQLY